MWTFEAYRIHVNVTLLSRQIYAAPRKMVLNGYHEIDQCSDCWYSSIIERKLTEEWNKYNSCFRILQSARHGLIYT